MKDFQIENITIINNRHHNFFKSFDENEFVKLQYDITDDEFNYLMDIIDDKEKLFSTYFNYILNNINKPFFSFNIDEFLNNYYTELIKKDNISLFNKIIDIKFISYKKNKKRLIEYKLLVILLNKLSDDVTFSLFDNYIYDRNKLSNIKLIEAIKLFPYVVKNNIEMDELETILN